MELRDKLEKAITEELTRLGYDLVKLELSTRGRKKNVRIYIEHRDTNITLDDCVSVSKAVGFMLDGEDQLPGPYNLEVSSPGINRPLVIPEHFERFRGRKARIQLSDGGSRETVIGKIIAAQDEEIMMEIEGIERSIAFSSIVRASLIDAESVD